MMRFVLVSVLLTVGLSSCNGQERKKTVTKDQNKPKTNIKVIKKYDKNGNLVKYDSTYSYYYSNVKNDSIVRDSAFSQFRRYFNNKYKFSEEPFFRDLFFQDSLLKYDFYNKDFFSKRFQNNMDKMGKLFDQMDSLKNQYFLEQVKPQVPKK
jgi:hypothetical protein